MLKSSYTTAPRRFKKSMAVDMMVSYYGRDYSRDCGFSGLIAGQKAESANSSRTYLNQHNVLRHEPSPGTAVRKRLCGRYLSAETGAERAGAGGRAEMESVRERRNCTDERKRVCGLGERIYRGCPLSWGKF